MVKTLYIVSYYYWDVLWITLLVKKYSSIKSIKGLWSNFIFFLNNFKISLYKLVMGPNGNPTDTVCSNLGICQYFDISNVIIVCGQRPSRPSKLFSVVLAKMRLY